MTYQKRKIIFIALTIIFFLSIPVIILFTEGYRIDFENRRLVQTGGLDLGIYNPNSLVFLNGELERETSFIFRSAIFRNIVPGDYEILVAKEGYKDWQKNTNVKKGHVTQFPYVRLFPEGLQKDIYTRDTRQIFVSPQQNYAIFLSLTPENEATQEAARSNVSFLDLAENEATTMTTESAEARLTDVGWTKNERVFFIRLESPQQTQILTGNINNPAQLVDWTSFIANNYPVALEGTTEIKPTISRNRLYIFRREENDTLSLNELNLENGTIRPRMVRNIAAYQVINEEIYYINTAGSLRRIDIEEQEMQELTSAPALDLHPENSSIKTSEDGNAVLVVDNGDLYLWQRGALLISVDENVDGAAFSGDSEKFIYWNDSKITAYWLEDVFGPPQREAGDTENINRFDRVQNVRWLNTRGTHVAVQTPDGVYIAEMDSRGGRNVAEYAIQSEDLIFQINREINALLIIKNENEFVSLSFE